MRSGAPRRHARVALGVMAFCAAVMIPARLGEAGAVLHGRAALDGGEPGRPGWVVRVDERLALRMPGLDDGDRRSLARTLVVEAELARIDPLLVLALIEVESSYEVDARSDRGAHGLMQLREPTLRREVERAGSSGTTTRTIPRSTSAPASATFAGCSTRSAARRSR